MKLPLNREISQWITPWLIAWRVTPNQATALSLAAGFLAGWNFFQGRAAGWLGGALWFEFSYLMDNCDGEIARRTHRVTGLGSWFDLVTDCLIHLVFFLTLGAGISRAQCQPLWGWLGVVSAAGVFLTYAAFLLQQVRQRGGAAWLHPDPPEGVNLGGFTGILRKVAREDFSLIVVMAALTHQMHWLLWAGAMGANLYWLATAAALGRTSRETPALFAETGGMHS